MLADRTIAGAPSSIDGFTLEITCRSEVFQRPPLRFEGWSAAMFPRWPRS